MDYKKQYGCTIEEAVSHRREFAKINDDLKEAYNENTQLSGGRKGTHTRKVMRPLEERYAKMRDLGTDMNMPPRPINPATWLETAVLRLVNHMLERNGRDISSSLARLSDTAYGINTKTFHAHAFYTKLGVYLTEMKAMYEHWLDKYRSGEMDDAELASQLRSSTYNVIAKYRGQALYYLSAYDALSASGDVNEYSNARAMAYLTRTGEIGFPGLLTQIAQDLEDEWDAFVAHARLKEATSEE